MERLLITGIAGGQGRLLARRLHKEAEVCGVDLAPWDGHPVGVEIHRLDLRKRKFEDILRHIRPTAVVHLGLIRHFEAAESTRHDNNVRGTKQLLDHCVSYGVEKLVVLSSGYVYGAFPENPYNLHEDAPLSASRSYPEIRDLVEVDSIASAFLWQYSEIATCVLRPVNVLGRLVRSTASRYLSQRRVPTVMGFNPMMQFIHEDDLTEAIALALAGGLRGVFNVVGAGEVPLHTAIRESGGRVLSVPEPLLRSAFGRLFQWGIGSWPPGMLDYLKYPITLCGKPFAEATGFQCDVGLREMFAGVRYR